MLRYLTKVGNKNIKFQKKFKNYIIIFNFVGIKQKIAKMSAVNLKSLDKNEMDVFLKSFDTVLTDCDGKLFQIIFIIHLFPYL